MNVIWKRPDGYHGATPNDFKVIEVGSHSNLWVHKIDKDTFPFRISGGWEEEEETKKLNNLINLLNSSDDDVVSYLNHAFGHSMKDKASEYFSEQLTWLGDLKKVLKGGNWEVEIMAETIVAVTKKMQGLAAKFENAQK